MLKKPESGGTPASARDPMVNAAVVTGRCLASPPISRMSCVCAAWMMTPAPRKMSDLKNACVVRWKSAAVALPAPRATNMRPSWLIVEYAATFLMSCCTAASSPPRRAVAAPMTSIAVIIAGTVSKMGRVRATTNTPAATIVAA